MATPVRDFWPLTPRPAVLPLPEPMPRPTRRRALRAPGRSASSESFIFKSSFAVTSSVPAGLRNRLRPRGDVEGGSALFVLDHADEVVHLGDHAAGHRGIWELLYPA